MRLEYSDFQPPGRVEGTSLLLRPLTVDHVALDYDAVVASRQMLQMWSQSGWPSADFTLEDNYQDLQRHQQEHESGIAFTYTVLTPQEDRCLGCVYIRPWTSLADYLGLAQREKPEPLAALHLFATFWVRQDQLNHNLDHRLLHLLSDWFCQEWARRRFAFLTNEKNRRQLALFRSNGLEPLTEISLSSRNSHWYFYPLPATESRDSTR